jgi:MtN3 and saliva related transmembrane protein
MSEIIGIIAGFFTTISFLPQAIRVLKTNDTRAISKTMYICFSFGVLLWLVYGIMIKSLAIIIANSVTLPLALVILWKKVREGKD